MKRRVTRSGIAACAAFLMAAALFVCAPAHAQSVFVEAGAGADAAAYICDGDHAIVSSTTGAISDCSPYKCSGDTCLFACATTSDCVIGRVCSNSECRAADEVDTTTDSGGCNAEGGAGASSILSVLFACIGLRRRRRDLRP